MKLFGTLIITTLLITSCLTETNVNSEENKDSLASLFKDAENLKINYWQWTSKNEITTWLIPLETEKLIKVFKQARPIKNKFLLCSHTYTGHYLTNNKEHHIAIKDVKDISKPCVITISQDYKFKKSFILEGELARTFLMWLELKLNKRSKTLKGKVEKRR